MPAVAVPVGAGEGVWVGDDVLVTDSVTVGELVAVAVAVELRVTLGDADGGTVSVTLGV